MKKTKIQLFSGIAIASLAVVAAGVAAGRPLHLFKADATSHVWNHYSAVAPTETSAGNKEYWVCCAHHEVSLVTPIEGTVTDASNPDFAAVVAGTEYNEAYLSNVKSNTFNIGYEKMSKTGAADEAWEHVAGFDSVVQGVRVQELAQTAYGMSGYSKAAADNDGNACKAGAIMLKTSEGTMTFPRIDYTKYEYVTVEYGIDTWNSASLKAWFGINSAEDLHAQSTAKYGTLRFVVEAGALKITDTVNGVSTTATVADADIVNGRAPVVFQSGSMNGRTFYMNALYIKTADHVHNYANFVPASDRFGRSVGQCTCGAQTYAAGTDVTTFTSEAQYGANGSYKSSLPTGGYIEGDDRTTGTIAYALGNPAKAKMNLPRVDFKSSGVTVFKFGTTLTDSVSVDQRYGLTYNGVTVLDKENHGNGYVMTIQCVYDSVANNVKMTSSINDGTVYETATITDAAVINGDTSLAFDVSINTTSYHVLGLNTIYINHHHTDTEALGGTCIESNYKNCSICGRYEKSATPLLEANLTSLTQFGMNGFVLETTDGDYKAPGTLRFRSSNPVQLPRVNYKAFKSVKYNIGIDSYNMDSLYCNIKIGDQYLIGSAETHNVYGRGEIVVTTEGDVVTVTINLKQQKTSTSWIATNSISFTDAAVANGTANLTLNLEQDSGRSFYLSNIVELEPNCDHATRVEYSNGVNCGEKCADCGKVLTKMVSLVESSMPSGHDGTFSYQTGVTFDGRENCLKTTTTAATNSAEMGWTVNYKVYFRGLVKNARAAGKTLISLTVYNKASTQYNVRIHWGVGNNISAALADHYNNPTLSQGTTIVRDNTTLTTEDGVTSKLPANKWIVITVDVSDAAFGASNTEDFFIAAALDTNGTPVYPIETYVSNIRCSAPTVA